MNLRQIRWESVGKLAAGLLLAVAIVITLPSLFASEKPKTLPPDVGLPQAALPPPPPPPAPVPKPKKTPKKKRKPKPRMRPTRKPRAHPHRRRSDGPAGSAPATAAPPITAPVTAVIPAGSRESFGFERP